MLSGLLQKSRSIDNQIINTIKVLTQTFNNVTDITGNKCATRSILPFIGDLLKTLFGTATYTRVNTLKVHINKLTCEENHLIGVFSGVHHLIHDQLDLAHRRTDANCIHQKKTHQSHSNIA